LSEYRSGSVRLGIKTVGGGEGEQCSLKLTYQGFLQTEPKLKYGNSKLNSESAATIHFGV